MIVTSFAAEQLAIKVADKKIALVSEKLYQLAAIAAVAGSIFMDYYFCNICYLEYSNFMAIFAADKFDYLQQTIYAG